MNTIKNTIVKRIRAKQRGWVFSPKDFLDVGNRDAVDKVLSRLVSQGMIRRLGRGVYDCPKVDETLGILSPSIDKVADVLAAKSGNTAFPSGAMAANMLGFSTQVPAKPFFLTNGKNKTMALGKQVVTLQHAHVAILNHLSYKLNLVIQALAYLGKNAIDDGIIKQCIHTLKQQDIAKLLKNAPSLPSWMVDIFHKIKQVKDRQLYSNT